MSFNIIAETDKKLNFNKIHKEVYSENLEFDFVPMPGLGIDGGDAIGICIPLSNVSESVWQRLKPILKKLKYKFGCYIYDLYRGQKFGFFNIDTFRENLFLN